MKHDDTEAAAAPPFEQRGGRPVPERADCLPASLAGRCANGYERGRGFRVHAVPRSNELERNGYCLTRALCGAKPGPRSAGWSYFGQRAVTCPRCAAKTPNARLP